MKIVGNKNLPALKATAHRSIDAAAETCRARFITAGPGQAMAYAQKLDEANRFLAAFPHGAPAGPDDDWPFLSAELGITAPTMWQVAEIISQLAAKWVGTAASIEKQRHAAKDAVSKATGPQGVTAAQVVTWPG